MFLNYFSFKPLYFPLQCDAANCLLHGAACVNVYSKYTGDSDRLTFNYEPMQLKMVPVFGHKTMNLFHK